MERLSYIIVKNLFIVAFILVVNITIIDAAHSSAGQEADLVIDPDSIKSFNAPPASTPPPTTGSSAPLINLPEIKNNDGTKKTPSLPADKTTPAASPAATVNKVAEPAKSMVKKIMDFLKPSAKKDPVSDKKDTPDVPIKPNTDKKSEVKSYKFSNWVGSIMFDASKIKDLNSALADFISGKNDSKSSNDSANSQAGKKVTSILDLATKDNISPSFYLNSILFRSDSDWTIWINKKKILYDKVKDMKFTIPQLDLVDINDQFVTFVWKTHELAGLSPDWKNKLTKADPADLYYSDNKNIFVKDAGNTIIFKLRPNQSFVVYDMEIREGFVPDHQIADTDKDKKDSQ
jgi:hypothetical protein